MVLGLVLHWLVAAPIEVGGISASSTASTEAATAAAAIWRTAPPPDWPSDPLEGPEAKRSLREALVGLVERLERLDGYRAVIRRQERVGGRLLREQTMHMKVRHRPSSIYVKNIGVQDGCEVLYVEGLRDGKLIGHPSGLAGLILPAMELDPHSSLAMSQSRYPVTMAGLLPVARMLRDDRRRDLDDPGATTLLDRLVDADGRLRYRSRHSYDAPRPGRPYARVEVLYDPDTLLIRAWSYADWPDGTGPDEPPLGGRFVVVSFDPSAVPSDLDFDAANPAYRFR